MADYGVTPEGFVRPTVQELKQQFEQDQLAEISPTLDVSTDSLIGQLNGIFGRQLGIAWEALEGCYNGFDPDAAEDALLVALCKLTGTDKRPASKTRVTCSVELDAGTALVNGDHFAHVENDPDLRFTPEEDFTAPSTGAHTVIFEAENTGPIQVLPGTLTVIATSVIGWNSITNPDIGTPGRNADGNATLRERREAQLTRSGSSTLDGLAADLIDLDEVIDVLPLENTTSEASNGLPPHSFEMVIWDNDPPEGDDDAIAQIIWDNKPSGIKSHGAESGTAIDAKEGEQTVHFSRSSVQTVYLDIELTPREGYVGDATFKTKLAAACNALFKIGDDVTHYDVLLETSGLGAKVSSLKLGLTAAPATSNDIPIDQRSIGRFSTVRITITQV